MLMCNLGRKNMCIGLLISRKYADTTTAQSTKAWLLHVKNAIFSKTLYPNLKWRVCATKELRGDFY